MDTRIGEYLRRRLTALLDNKPFDLQLSISQPHVGVYLSIYSAKNEQIFRQGFMGEKSETLIKSVDTVIQSHKSKLQKMAETATSVCYLTIITDCVYLKEKLNWNENQDGVYMQWGQRYRGIFLPHEVKSLGLPKITIMDRLCAFQMSRWEDGMAISLPSSLWRLPEGLVYRVVGETHKF